MERAIIVTFDDAEISKDDLKEKIKSLSGSINFDPSGTIPVSYINKIIHLINRGVDAKPLPGKYEEEETQYADHLLRLTSNWNFDKKFWM